jgi:hypothetical protein
MLVLMDFFKSNYKLLILIFVFFTGCGVFEPRRAEYPIIKPEQEPFNFASILWGTGKTFNKLEYNDLFSDNVVYIDINGNEYYKDMLVNNLYKIQSRFIIKSAFWQFDSLQDFSIGDTFFIDRKYHIIVTDTLTIPPKDYDFYDKASFKLIFNSTKNTWNIFYFKDKYPGKSIFHPLFSPDL